MNQADHFTLLVQRLRQTSREIAMAIALTIVAVTFLMTTMMGEKESDGPPLAAVQRPQ